MEHSFAQSGQQQIDYGAEGQSFQQATGTHMPMTENARTMLGGEQYQRLSLREQIRLRPDTYIGANAGITTETVWVAQEMKDNLTTNLPIKVTESPCQISLAICGTTKEIFDNATDNLERSKLENIDPGIIETEFTQNTLTVRNYGKHIDIVIHHKEQIWVPQMIFGELLTSDNYNDSIDRFKIGRNGYGVKLANIFSLIFQVIVGDPVRKLKYTQVWQNAMTVCSQPTIEPYDGIGFTQVSCVPDFPFFYQNPSTPMQFAESMHGIFLYRTMGMSFAGQVITKFNGQELDYRNAEKFFEAHCEAKDPLRKQIKWTSADGYQEFVMADMPKKGFQAAYVNGTPVHEGEHINEFLRAVFKPLCDKFEAENKKKVTVNHLKKHVALVLRCRLDKPEFSNQIKSKLVKPKTIPAAIRNEIPAKLQKEVLKWELEEALKAEFGMKTKKTEAVRRQKTRIAKCEPAILAGHPGESYKCTLIVVEGDSPAGTLLSGLKYLPGGKRYNGVYPLRGKIMNVNRHNDQKVEANRVLSDVLEILKAERGVDYSKPANFNKLHYGKIAFMTDADDDGQHITGLGINFIFSTLREIAPFEFSISILTPVVVATHKRSHQVLKFYYNKQFLKWQKENASMDEWNCKYYKGLGSWDSDKDSVLKDLFQQPVVVSYTVDAQSDDILKLVFDKNMADQRKKWISDYDPNSFPNYTNPRPITDFFQEEFRYFSRASVIRSTPRLMDGMKPVHRKVLYSMFLKFSKASTTSNKNKPIKVPQFGGFVMEKTAYHHGEQALFDTILGLAQRYVTGPNNLPLIRGEGVLGTRWKRGKDAAASRYLKVSLEPIAYYIYREEDWPLMEILYDEGEPVEPKEMYPIIPMCLINKCEGIGTGWSTKIYPHHPMVVCDYVIAWINERKQKREVPLDKLEIDVSNKPELVPWWKGYKGELRRIKNQPFEVYLNLGSFHVNMHVTFVTELPLETSIEQYKLWLAQEEAKYEETPAEAMLRTFDNMSQPPNVDFRVYGIFAPTYEKLKLVKTLSMSNMILIDKDEKPTKYNYSFEIICAWAPNRLEIYEKRRLHIIKELEAKLRMTSLRYLFISDIVDGRLVLNRKKPEEYIPYMESKGYPCNKKRDGDDFTLMPIKSCTANRLRKLEQELSSIKKELEYYKQVWAEDLWLKDLLELKAQIDKFYARE